MYINPPELQIWAPKIAITITRTGLEVFKCTPTCLLRHSADFMDMSQMMG